MMYMRLPGPVRRHAADLVALFADVLAGRPALPVVGEAADPVPLLLIIIISYYHYY